MIPLVIVRPEPGATTTLNAARHLHLDARSFPLFVMQPFDWRPVARESVDAVLLGSANAVRLGSAALEPLRGLPAYCVGKATAAQAEAAGFRVAGLGSGGLQDLVAAIAPEHRRVLRLAGAAHVPLRIPPGLELTTRVVYEAVALPLPQELEAVLRSPCVVMLHSAEAARHFATLVDRAGLDRASIGLAVIGPRAAPPAGDGWAALRCAPRPEDAALLALAHEMCQDPDRAP